MIIIGLRKENKRKKERGETMITMEEGNEGRTGGKKNINRERKREIRMEIGMENERKVGKERILIRNGEVEHVKRDKYSYYQLFQSEWKMRGNEGRILNKEWRG